MSTSTKPTHTAWPHHWQSQKIKKCLSPADLTATSTRRTIRQKAEKERRPYVFVQGSKELEKIQGYPGSSRLEERQESTKHGCICHTYQPACQYPGSKTLPLQICPQLFHICKQCSPATVAFGFRSRLHRCAKIRWEAPKYCKWRSRPLSMQTTHPAKNVFHVFAGTQKINKTCYRWDDAVTPLAQSSRN